jgi:hypothetical protein
MQSRLRPMAGRILHPDHQGSIVPATTPSGDFLATDGYDEWGIPKAAKQGRFGYTGQAWIRGRMACSN